MVHIDQADPGSLTEQEKRWQRGEFRVPVYNVAGLEARLEKLNRRARKLGSAPIVLTKLGEEQEMVQGPNGKPTGAIRVYAMLKLVGVAPKLNGWTFVAALDVVEGGTVIRAVPGETVPVAYRTAAPTCEHCRLARNRVKHYLVRDDAGAHKMVGSSCLADFLGHQNPENYARMAEYLSSAADLCGEAEGGNGGPHAPTLWITETYLAAVASAIDAWGWRSRTVAREMGRSSTSDDAFNILDDKAWKRNPAERPTITDAHRAKAAEAHAWIQALAERANLSDYEHNMMVSGSGETFLGRHAGLVASAIAAVAREQEREIKRRQAATQPRSTNYVGKVGDKVEMTATVIGLKTIPGDWGATTILKIQDAEGRKAVWFSSRTIPQEVAIGGQVALRGTVKDQKEYNGEAETVLTRCKIVAKGAN